MEDKVIVGILSFLAAIIGVIIGALSTQAATQRRIQMENVVQERAKWRSRVRCLASEVHKAMMIAHFNTRRKKLHELQNRFRAVLNPNDCKDNNIIEAIDSACKCKCENRCNCENEREKKADKFGELISLLLKHDWERAKEEVKHPLLQWWKPEPASCIKFRLIHAFTARNTGLSGRSNVWLMFTASEDKPHAVFLNLVQIIRSQS